MACAKRAATNPMKISGISGSSIVGGSRGHVSFEKSGVRSRALGIVTKIARVAISTPLFVYLRPLGHFNTLIENTMSQAIKIAFNKAIEIVLAEILIGSNTPWMRVNDVTSHKHG